MHYHGSTSSHPLHCTFHTHSYHYITCFIHLTFYLGFTSSRCYTTLYHDSTSSQSIRFHQHIHITTLHASYTLRFILVFTSSHCYTTLYHDSTTSSHSIMLHQPQYKCRFNCLCVFSFVVFFLQSYCFVLLCSFLLVCGDHCPRIGSFFSLIFIVIALFLCLFCFSLFFLFCKVDVVVFFCFVPFTPCMSQP